MKLPRLFTFVFVASIVFCTVGSVYAISFGGPGGKWPKSWPKELEPLRKQAWTWVHGQIEIPSYEIPFDNREEFESAWPHILKLKRKGAPITLSRGPHIRVKSAKTGGVRVRSHWAKALYDIELVVDGDIVDLNRIRLPADTRIIDERFKENGEQKKRAPQNAAEQDGGGRVEVVVDSGDKGKPGGYLVNIEGEKGSKVGSDDRNVLQNLAQYDSIYRAGFALSATERRLDYLFEDGPVYPAVKRWRLTHEGDRVGFVIDLTDYEEPSYLPPDQRPEGIGLGVRIQKWGYWGDEACGNHYVEATFEVTPDGQVTRRGTMHDVSLFGPRDITPMADKASFQWAMGRFFSEHIDKVTHVEESEGGRLHVSALGNRHKGHNGKWELVIEPDAAWIVREARFYGETKPDKLKAHMSNEGTVWSGSFCIPQKAVVNVFGRAAEHSGHSFTFDPVVDEFDEELYKQCEQAVLHGDQPQLVVTDERVSPRTITEPNRPGFKPAKARGR
jgi:hypothetical protein